MDLKETQRLAKVTTEAEAIDLTVAFVQLYREHAKYLDRPYKWLAKVGLDWVQAQIVEDPDNRAALIARFDLSQSVYQRDPWADRATPQAQADFAPLADFTREAAE
jgi:nitrite reductase (NADH) large subunit